MTDESFLSFQVKEKWKMRSRTGFENRTQVVTEPSRVIIVTSRVGNNILLEMDITNV